MVDCAGSVEAFRMLVQKPGKNKAIYKHGQEDSIKDTENI
jgi:hypothetical protein